jgi:hypothetical protein
MSMIKQLSLVCLSIFLLTGVACKRTLTQAELQSQLKDAMAQFLNKKVNSDSSGVKFEVKEVNFFEDDANYICRFTVRMLKRNGYDTTGAMAAKISKDFKTVRRSN